MSKQSEVLITEKHSKYGRRIIQNGLLVGDGITVETWREIFTREPPPGWSIINASGDAAFAAYVASSSRQRHGRTSTSSTVIPSLEVSPSSSARRSYTTRKTQDGATSGDLRELLNAMVKTGLREIMVTRRVEGAEDLSKALKDCWT